MEKERLLKLLESEPNDIDAIGMILSNYTDYGHTELGGMVSVKQFSKVAEVVLEWVTNKRESKHPKCPCCGSDKTYITEAIHCSRCAVTSEI